MSKNEENVVTVVTIGAIFERQNQWVLQNGKEYI
jgi:hypothetical protein